MSKRHSRLRHVVLEEKSHLGRQIWKLRTKGGVPIPAFARCMKEFVTRSYRTRLAYAKSLAKFFDYLVAANAFSRSFTLSELGDLIKAYPLLLEQGSVKFAADIRNGEDCEDELWLADAADALQFEPLAVGSMDNALPPVNALIQLSEVLGESARQRAQFLGIPYHSDILDSIGDIAVEKHVSHHEHMAMRQNSLLGNVVRVCKKLKRPVGMLRRTKKVTIPFAERDFPRQYFRALVAAATCWRDRVLWLLLGVLGLRVSEALNIGIDDIDFENQCVYITDPTGTRDYIDSNDERSIRFKGRATCLTFPIPEFKQHLFLAIQKYVDLEWVASHEPGRKKFLLQYIEATRRGQAYVDVSYTNLSGRYKKAADRAMAPHPLFLDSHKEHALRHMYGVYWVNDHPTGVPGREFGLELVAVQRMMGHSTLEATEVYARKKLGALHAAVAAVDARLHSSNQELLEEIN